jgi:hypothetical protein
MGHVRGRGESNQCFVGHLEEEDHSENINVDGKIILQQVSEEIRSEGVNWIYLS